MQCLRNDLCGQKNDNVKLFNWCRSDLNCAGYQQLLVHGDLYNKGSLMPLLLQKSPKFDFCSVYICTAGMVRRGWTVCTYAGESYTSDERFKQDIDVRPVCGGLGNLIHILL